MHLIFGNMSAETARATAESMGVLIDLAGIGLCASGLIVLGVWLWRYGGPKALGDAPVRRNGVPLPLPFLLFIAWLFSLYGLGVLVKRIYGGIDSADATAMSNLLMLALNVGLIAVMLGAGYGLFARRLKGFGLNPRTLLKDTGWGTVNLIAVYPLVIGGVALVTLIGRVLTGPDYTIPAHQSLEELMAFEQVWVRAAVIVLVVAVVPVMEELLFRGLLQTAMRSLLPGVWPGVVMTSGLFAIVHSPTHAPAIFALACGLGYAYERSGSLFRPIVMHVLFNASGVAAALLL